MIISKEVQFDAGHRVPEHGSKCRHPHGHRYRVVAYAAGEIQRAGEADGMVLDFGDLKRGLTEAVHDPLDHGFLVSANDAVLRDALDREDWKVTILDETPTAENLAVWCWEHLSAWLERHAPAVTLAALEVWETPTSMARIGQC